MIVHLLSFFVALFVGVAGVVVKTSWAVEAATGKKNPIEITADGAMEWDRTHKQYIARGNAVAVQGDTTITADQLTAEYNDDPAGGTKISRMLANGNVQLQKADMVSTGENAIYDLTTQTATMTGKILTLTMPNKQLTATDTFEYKIDQGIIKAIGDAVLIDGEDRLAADIVTAWLDQNNQLKRAEATGHVVITTPKETAKAARATYDAVTNIAQLFDQVEITQGKNIVTGTRAEINLTTNISKVFGTKNKTGRVKAVFYP